MSGLEQYLKFNLEAYINDLKLRPYLFSLDGEVNPTTRPSLMVSYINRENQVMFIKNILGYFYNSSNPEDVYYISTEIEITHSDIKLLSTERPFRLVNFIINSTGEGNREGLKLPIPLVVRPNATVIARFNILSGYSGTGSSLVGLTFSTVLADLDLLKQYKK